ncbi:hypothetical protein [Rhodococcus sp. MTM3W5.2]|uniref:hypothetical protein n=1 Tax=Rhodococcus sp. MTM3W5.2 TaxID=1805827 RepID=UPI0011AE792F|nr:hypothetical protein [Rhodococcus sp. MTM3W5.2]
MRLVRLYTNKPNIFDAIQFHDGLSVVVAEIRMPENKGKTVHNLGKSTVARLVDFCLLKGKHASFFLFKHGSLFEGFVFFLEVQLDNGTYLTVARSLESRNSVSILVSDDDVTDATIVGPNDWLHIGLGVSPAKRLLDGLFGFSVVSPMTIATSWDMSCESRMTTVTSFTYESSEENTENGSHSLHISSA